MLPASAPAARALGCLMQYGVAQVRITGEMPRHVLDVVAGALAAAGDQHAVAVAAAVGRHLPALHHHAPAFAAAHRAKLYTLSSDSRLSPAAALGPRPPAVAGRAEPRRPGGPARRTTAKPVVETPTNLFLYTPIDQTECAAVAKTR